VAVNTFVMSGEVKRLEVNNKPTKKGQAAIIVLQYGPNRQRTDQAVQFLNVSLIRIPPYVYEKCKDKLKVGSMIDVTGHLQGVLKHVINEGYVTNEMVADRLQFCMDDEDVPAGEAEATAAVAGD
jgi:hypothetical protein